MTKRHPPTPAGLTVLTASDVDTLLSTLDAEPALDIQARVFKSFSAQHAAQAADAIPGIQAPQRIVTTTPAQTMLFMPSRAAEAGGTAIKIVSVPNNGGAEGLPATTLVLDEESGKVKGVVNARKLTALRNACGAYLIVYLTSKMNEARDECIWLCRVQTAQTTGLSYVCQRHQS
jgi:ornithine cyclodeaminase